MKPSKTDIPNGNYSNNTDTPRPSPIWQQLSLDHSHNLAANQPLIWGASTDDHHDEAANWHQQSLSFPTPPAFLSPTGLSRGHGDTEAFYAEQQRKRLI
ncbi:unnamed protein product [Cylindrotheca closterium]|uniref:Uncharacterized protein n=1 Tax=Cylindrotheca closterium TaxID=2856 RepID=A0AAD2FCS2_9STRA|nr:unnamed protein product [Cylindrotheca closterium]